MLPSEKRGRFLEASGSNDGKYPILWQTDSTHSPFAVGLLGGMGSPSLLQGRESIIATKGFGNESFWSERKGGRVSNSRGSHPHPLIGVEGREWSWEVLFIRQAAGKFVYLGAGSLLRSAVRRSRGEGREEVSEKERKEADSKSNFIPSPLIFFTLSPHRDVT